MSGHFVADLRGVPNGSAFVDAEGRAWVRWPDGRIGRRAEAEPATAFDRLVLVMLANGEGPFEVVARDLSSDDCDAIAALPLDANGARIALALGGPWRDLGVESIDGPHGLRELAR